MKPFAIVVAMDEARGIGKAGGLAWHLPADLKHFKEITAASTDPSRRNAVLMGRKTWESLPERFRPLPGRLNVVLSRQQGFLLPNGVPGFSGLEEALSHVGKEQGVGEVFVIGGAQLYAEAIDHPACTRIFATDVKGAFDCDAFFPAIPSRFKSVETGPWLSEGSVSYRFVNHKI